MSLIILLLVLPIMILVGSMILILHGRPIFFTQARAGHRGKEFSILKFRTLPVSERGASSFTNQRLLQSIRAYGLDELPNLINVIKGEMSLVGPRPLLVKYLPLYAPEQARRHEVLPGITGWAQINGRNTLIWEQKFELDVWYVDNQSFWLDIKILFLTVYKVLKREGVSVEGEATVAEFRGSGKNKKSEKASTAE